MLNYIKNIVSNMYTYISSESIKYEQVNLDGHVLVFKMIDESNKDIKTTVKIKLKTTKTKYVKIFTVKTIKEYVIHITRVKGSGISTILLDAAEVKLYNHEITPEYYIHGSSVKTTKQHIKKIIEKRYDIECTYSD